MLTSAVSFRIQRYFFMQFIKGQKKQMYADHLKVL